ncbi:hypothetical protein BKH46_07435 [Helicobacter sp. 12S02634-8]|uniref:glycoside hydrolase family protein n=1 Tax=Helicobacter sp. 12S02634-8 TaxID=1476199 RepID=UPI000BA78447|nr:hypothetical protein [Helicobacter sp. 12S02634-8]PAF46413.1 hypothetical protein BKH46_07435 [Helicobacter sp. 12S02634-8]
MTKKTTQSKIPLELINAIKNHEGYSRNVYMDTMGIETIGYGRNIKAHPLSEEEKKMIEHNYGEYSKEEAEKWLIEHLEELYDALTQFRWFHKLDSTRQGIILDMAYNLGIPRLLLFKKMILALNSGDYANASYEMLNSGWAMQTKRRAKYLSELMRTHKEPKEPTYLATQNIKDKGA